MEKFSNKIMNWLISFGVDKYLNIIAGLIIAAVFNIVLGMQVCIIPVAFAAFAIELFRCLPCGKITWWNIFANLLGGAVIQMLVVLGTWINV